MKLKRSCLCITPRFLLLVSLLCVIKAEDASQPEISSETEDDDDDKPEVYRNTCNNEPSFLRCDRQVGSPSCSGNTRYREQGATCNNLQSGRTHWGSANICYNRLLPPSYADGIRSIRRSVRGGDLPPARRVSLRVHQQGRLSERTVTHLYMLFGQFISHEINLTPFSRSANNLQLECCGADRNNAQCLPILTGDSEDSFYRRENVNCINFARSVPCAACARNDGRTPVNQQDIVSSIIDGSIIYGNSQQELNNLRTSNGKLRWFDAGNAGDLLPQSTNNQDGCNRPQTNEICFTGGDSRINQHLSLTAFHTVWLRCHNYVADNLRLVNRRWDNERLFQESRRIVVAVFQLIIYDEYVPYAVGPDYMDYFNMWVNSQGRRTSYNSNVDPTLVTEFSTAAFRFGHSMVASEFRVFNNQVLLRDLFAEPFSLYRGSLDSVILGMVDNPPEVVDQHLVPDITNFLYRARENRTGLDLAAINIQRGRDNGLQPYVEYVKKCQCKEICDWNDLNDLMPRENIRRLQNVYSDVRDIDLFSGGLSEYPIGKGGLNGRTFSCILAREFWKLKFGDRFYFEHGGRSEHFNNNQLNQIKRMSLSKIFCLVTRIDFIQPWALRPAGDRSDNNKQRCNNADTIDFGFWRE